ncbi:MAG: hypothetical protein AMXMBFR47_25140 [Planctomycetota bacterium]
MMAGAIPIAEPEVQVKEKILPPYKVVLHNDDVNTFEHVILSILRLTPLKEEEAIERTIEAHETGVAVLLVTTRERAELYVEQFTSCGLIVTCEPDE